MAQQISSSFRKALQAIVLTVFTGGSFHLALVGVSVIKGAHQNANPVHFLGISLLFPQLASSRVWFIGLWIALFACGFGYFYLLLRSKKHLAFITASPRYQRLQRRITRTQSASRILAIAMVTCANDEPSVTTAEYTPVQRLAIYE